MDNTVKDFIEQHRINVIDDTKRAHRYGGIRLNFFADFSDYNVVAQDIVQYETERLFTVEITERELTRIAEFESQVFNNMKSGGHYNMFEVLMEQKEEEQRMRKKYQSVQKAYEHYSLLLSLAESGEL